jgi:hypothetical protein
VHRPGEQPARDSRPLFSGRSFQRWR